MFLTEVLMQLVRNDGYVASRTIPCPQLCVAPHLKIWIWFSGLLVCKGGILLMWIPFIILQNQKSLAITRFTFAVLWILFSANLHVFFCLFFLQHIVFFILIGCVSCTVQNPFSLSHLFNSPAVWLWSWFHSIILELFFYKSLNFESV